MFILLWKNWYFALYSLKSKWVELLIYMSLIPYLAKYNCEPKITETNNSDILCYTPKYDKFINNLMEGVRVDLGMPSNKLSSFKNEDDMLTFLNSRKADRSFAVHFYTYVGPKSITEANMTYTIKTGHQSNIPRTFLLDKKYEGPYYDDYASSGVINLKQVIDAGFRKLTEPIDYNMSYVRAEAVSRPSKPEEPCDTNQEKITTFGLILLILIKKLLISLVLSPLVQEKENGAKEFMALPPIYAALNDLAFFLISYLLIFVYIVLNLLFTTVYSPLGEISFSHVYGLFAVYLLSDMAYTFMVSTLFDSVFYAKVGGILFHYVPLVLSSANESTLNKYSFLVGGNLFYQAIEIFYKFSINARNFGTDLKEGELLHSIYSSLVLQFIAYMFLYFYLYAVIPGKGRKRQPFYFIVHPSFYFDQKEPQIELLDEDCFNKQGIKVIKLMKTFREGYCNRRVVLNDINISIDSNCITTLIGTNDSGKTALINMILGYVTQTSGEIIVEGNRDPAKYRNIIGFAPKNNILLPYFTCTQHLIFFGCLKGADFGNAEKDAEKLLNGLKLFDTSLLSIENLTPAMQRKLSLGIALTGCTKIIVLDQPTSGLDIVSRREIWNMLLELKYSKTILIATHDMEETEILSDNIIFMSNGKVLQAKPALEFKYQYGCDYILKLDIEEDFNIQETMNLIQEFIPKAKVDTYSDTSIYIRIPYSYKSIYTDLLSKLEEITEDLKISKISVTNHFIDDAFFHSTKEYDDAPDHSMPNEFQENRKQYNRVVDITTRHENATNGISSKEIIATFYKKLIYIKREIVFSLFSFLIPLISIGLAFTAINFHDSNELQPACNINGSKIFIVSSEKFQKLQDTIIYDIRKRHGTPILISEQHLADNIFQNLENKQIKYINERVFVVVEFDDDSKGRLIRVVHFGNPQTCKSKKIVNMINDSISKTEKPLAKKIRVELTDLSVKSIVTPRTLKYYSSIVPVGWFLYIIFYVSLPYKEAKTKFKLLQNISPLRYWYAFTLADICLHTILCAITIVGQKIFDSIYSDSEQTTLMLSFMFYGFGYFPILYILARSFEHLATIISCLITPMILSAILHIIPSIGWNILPDISLKHQLLLINKNYFIHARNETFMAMHAHNITEKYKGIVWFYGSMTVALFGFSAILIFFCERRFLIHTSCKEPILPIITNKNVLAEKKMVEDLIKENKQKEYALIINKLVTPFKSSDKDSIPLPSLSFAVRPGECFGIVGLNDSGKTQAMQQFTGNIKIKSGVVNIYMIKLHTNLNTFKLLTGYGMQVNALNDFMTPKETLKYIALLRGLNDNEILRVIMDWMKKLDFTKFENTLIKECSYATKRKLCMSIAMIGNPAVIFLDEPTNGVDPKSRILMWNCIKEVQKENKTVILSTNNLDECEYLCSRIAVLSRGYMQNIGKIPQLKANFKYGCILTIKLKNEYLLTEINLLVLKLSEIFGGYIIFRAPIIRYFVSEQPLLWSSIFARMQTLSEEHKNVIEDSYVKEVTIEGLLINNPTIPAIAAV